MQIDNLGSSLFDLREGDRIIVTTAGGVTATGIFLRIVGNFLLWVRIVGGNPVLTITDLNGISISRV